MILKYADTTVDLVPASEHYSRAQLREVIRQLTSGEHGIDMILGAPDGSVSFRWTRGAWKKFEEECKWIDCRG